MNEMRFGNCEIEPTLSKARRESKEHATNTKEARDGVVQGVDVLDGDEVKGKRGARSSGWTGCAPLCGASLSRADVGRGPPRRIHPRGYYAEVRIAGQ